MITATINGEIKQFDDKKYKTFKEFYDENKLDGKVLSKLIINGKEVPVSKLDDIFSATFEGGELIEMSFEDLIPFTLNLLSNLMEYFDKFENALPAFAKNISSGSSQSIEGLKNLQEGIKALEVMKTNLFALTGTNEGDFSELQSEKEKLQDTLGKMNQRIFDKNWTELSQLIEYDLPEAIRYYKILFKKAADILNQKKS
ncbi:MAG: hypothetical protein ACOC4J_03470 [Bacteroidota bacterium]